MGCSLQSIQDYVYQTPKEVIAGFVVCIIPGCYILGLTKRNKRKINDFMKHAMFIENSKS